MKPDDDDLYGFDEPGFDPLMTCVAFAAILAVFGLLIATLQWIGVL